MRKFIYLLVLFFVSSCQKKVTNYIGVETLTLKDCEEIVYKEIILDDLLLSYPTGMFFINGELVVKDEKGHQTLFHMITKEGETVQEFLKQGNGPEEYITSNFNSQLSEDGILDMFDSSRKNIVSFKIKDGIFQFSGIRSIAKVKEFVLEAIDYGDYILAMGANGRFQKNRFLVLDTLGNVIRAMGDYPEIQPELLDEPKEDLQTILFHTSFFRMAPDKKKAVFASYKGALMQFLDLSALPDSVLIRSIQLEKPKKKEQITREHDGWVYGFEDIYVTNDHVYAIYNGETAIENPEFGRYLLKYDWKGNLLKQYKLDVGIRCLAVDETNKIIYFVGYVNDEMRLFYGYLK